jgi:hypothetical protein
VDTLKNILTTGTTYGAAGVAALLGVDALAQTSAPATTGLPANYAFLVLLATVLVQGAVEVCKAILARGKAPEAKK